LPVIEELIEELLFQHCSVATIMGLSMVMGTQGNDVLDSVRAFSGQSQYVMCLDVVRPVGKLETFRSAVLASCPTALSSPLAGHANFPVVGRSRP